MEGQRVSIREEYGRLLLQFVSGAQTPEEVVDRALEALARLIQIRFRSSRRQSLEVFRCIILLDLPELLPRLVSDPEFDRAQKHFQGRLEQMLPGVEQWACAV